MSVWKDIDKLLAKHKAELATTTAEVKALGGGWTRVDRHVWWCSWRPTCGDRATQRLSAFSGPALVAALKEAQAVHAARTEAAKKAAVGAG